MKIYAILMVVYSGELEGTYKKVIGVKKAKSLSEEGIEVSDLAKKIALTELENLYKRTDKDTTGYKEDYINDEYVCKVESTSPKGNVVTVIVNFQEFVVDANINKLYAICNYEEHWFTTYIYSNNIELYGVNFRISKVNPNKESAINYFNSAKESILTNLNDYLEEKEELDDIADYERGADEEGTNLIDSFKCRSSEETNHACALFELDVD